MIPLDELPAVKSGLARKLPPRWLRAARSLLAHLRCAGAEVAAVLSDCGAWIRRRWPWLVAAQALVLLAGWMCIAPNDEAWRHATRTAFPVHHELALSVAGYFSFWGDFVGFNVSLVVLFWVLGHTRRSLLMRRIAISLLLTSVLAGAAANVARFSIGRARPNANAPDGFYGPRFEGEYHALPSAHTSTAFGVAIPLAIAMPQAGVPALIVAAGVSWSRLYRNQHRPTDVFCGVWLAALFGVPLGLAARRSIAPGLRQPGCMAASRTRTAGSLPAWSP